MFACVCIYQIAHSRAIRPGRDNDSKMLPNSRFCPPFRLYRGESTSVLLVLSPPIGRVGVNNLCFTKLFFVGAVGVRKRMPHIARFFVSATKHNEVQGSTVVLSENREAT